MMRTLPFFVTAVMVMGLLGAHAAHAEANASTPEETRVDLTASASKKVLQDTLQATLHLRIEGDTAEEVQDSLNRRMEGIWDKAKSVESVEAELVGYRVWHEKPRRYRDERKDTEEKWVGTQTISLKSKDFDVLRNLVGDLQSMGMAVNHLRFFVSDTLREQTEDALIPVVAQELASRARKVAAAFGVEAVRLGTIVLGRSAGGPPVYRAHAMEADSSGGGGSAAPVAAPVYEDVALNMSADAYIQTVKLD